MSDPEDSTRPPSDESPGRTFRAAGRAADAGWTLSGSVIGCLAIGYALGEYFGRNPEATIAGLVVGLVVGLYSLAKAMGLFGASGVVG